MRRSAVADPRRPEGGHRDPAEGDPPRRRHRAAGVLGRIAHGRSESHVERAADVMLEQRRTLVLCLREAPSNLIHLRNVVAVSDTAARRERTRAR
ncbi:flavoprotein [Streptomyces sp. NPDC004533]|uniref:flavoprotein n=1 Tax=Streptomyces sp. NPDC004533 TaxID=3154278 RepID=UPI0033BD3D22